MPRTSHPAIRVRMYRVGFGDCFLVTLPVESGDAHILIDCGVHPQGDIKTMAKVVQDIEAETAGKLAIVVATHAHQDHISGFGKFAAQFRRFRIGEVWMPWTENLKDDRAAKLKEKHKRAVAHLQMYFASLPAAARVKSEDAVQAVANLSGNEAALDQLRTGFGTGAKARYFQAGESVEKPAGIEGLSTQILGPPTDTEFLARMDPPAGQHYLTGNDGKSRPMDPAFGSQWIAGKHEHARLSKRDLDLIHQFADEPPDALAFALDQVINNTSLVTLLSFGGKRLLFPGDAQYGNWQFWLGQSGASEILAGIDFLKVAHHGSMNATPKQAIDNMGSGKLAAMVSTQSHPWPSIPREPLMDAIRARTKNRMVRSDSLAVPGADDGPALERVPSGFARGALWFDYRIEL